MTTGHAVEGLLVAFAVIFWLASAYWTVKDARRRIDDSWLLVLAALVGLVPYVGPLVYMLFRPPEYLDDVRERELEIKAMEDRLSRRGLICPVCRTDVEPTFRVCPICTTKLRQGCASCGSPLEALWQICPYCETPIDSSASRASWGAAPDL